MYRQFSTVFSHLIYSFDNADLLNKRNKLERHDV